MYNYRSCISEQLHEKEINFILSLELITILEFENPSSPLWYKYKKKRRADKNGKIIYIYKIEASDFVIFSTLRLNHIKYLFSFCISVLVLRYEEIYGMIIFFFIYLHCRFIKINSLGTHYIRRK